MSRFNVEQILRAVNGKLIVGTISVQAKGISTDSRKIERGQLFIAIKGEKFDGHDYIDDVIKKGAAVIIVSDRIRINFKKINTPIVIVPDTIKALGDLARYHRNRFKIPVIAVTGSNGKTTTKEMIASVLESRFNVLKNIKTENNSIGVALTLLKLDQRHTAAVVETGMNHAGEIRYLTSMLQPNIAVVTNIGPSHLEFLRNMENVYKAKMEVFENFKKDDWAVLNADDKYLLRNNKFNFKCTTFGVNKICDYRATKLVTNLEGIKFVLNSKYNFKLNLIGHQNVYNALAAIAVARILGIDYKSIKNSLSDFNNVSGRMQVKKIKNILLIDDTYNSNPQSMCCAIQTLSQLNTKGNRILVSGDMLELGAKSRGFHRQIGQLAADSGINYIISIGRFSKDTLEAARSSGMKNSKLYNLNSKEDIAKTLLGLVNPNDAILVKGSRAMKMEEVIECFTNYYTH